MKNYTTQTASLKATTVDTRLLDAKQIDTNKLFINGTQFDPSQLKESPNDAMFALIVRDTGYILVSMKLDQSGDNQMFSSGGLFAKGSESEGTLPNGVYAVIQLDDNFVKCIGGNSLNDTDVAWVYNIPLAKFEIERPHVYGIMFEQCILENFIIVNNDEQNGESFFWAIKICEEDDNLSELYGGKTEEYPQLMFLVSIPYGIPENDTSSSAYSLRKTNPLDSLREKIEEMRQQMLDKSAE